MKLYYAFGSCSDFIYRGLYIREMTGDANPLDSMYIET